MSNQTTSPYQAHIDRCRQPKSWLKVKNILTWLQLGIRNKYDTKQLCEKLNARSIKPLVSNNWTVNSLQMQLLKMARLDSDSSLAAGWAYLMKTGSVTNEDHQLLLDRVK